MPWTSEEERKREYASTIDVTDLVRIERIPFEFSQLLRCTRTTFRFGCFGPRVSRLTYRDKHISDCVLYFKYVRVRTLALYRAVLCRFASSWSWWKWSRLFTSHSFPWRIFITQCAFAWSCMADPWPSPQQSTMRLNLPFPSSTRFLVYLRTKRTSRVITRHFFSLFENVFETCALDTFNVSHWISIVSSFNESRSSLES